ncbi:MAG: motility associated factor glycosyltransferase family protein [Lachnospiraceae bacterium]|nr:motility associated factor glycosyltransferase family protein [Lachnospiraceae bacterium]
MAEDFIEEIYHDSMSIEYINEFVHLSYICKRRDARRAYNEGAKILENMISRIASSNLQLALDIQNTALEIAERFEDCGFAAGEALSRLLPLLYEAVAPLTHISVDAGSYVIKSADSGFLTLYDSGINMHIHDTHDPMWEAYNLATELYRPEVEQFYILGCGLGYLPYQIWWISGGASCIRVYEEDEKIIEYAYNYGVLGWIPEELIEVISGDAKYVSERFLKETHQNSNSCAYISDWKRRTFTENGYDSIVRTAANLELARSMHDITEVNRRKNLQLKSFSFDKIHDSLAYDEWIVVGAGPSLNDAVGFLRDSKGKRGIIAVNTVLKRLCIEGIMPDISVAADRYAQLEDHIRGIEDYTADVPLIADQLTNWRYTGAYKGMIVFVKTSAGNNEPEDSDIWKIGGTVSSMGIEAAARLDAKTIYLVGLDLAYPGGQKYAVGMPHHQENMEGVLVQVPSVDGNMVETSEVFCWFREVIEEQIATHNGIRFVNMSKHGALINGAEKFNRT